MKREGRCPRELATNRGPKTGQDWQDPRLLKVKSHLWVGPVAAGRGTRDQGLHEPLISLLRLSRHPTCLPRQSLTWREGWLPLPHPHPLDLHTGCCRPMWSLSWVPVSGKLLGMAGGWDRWERKAGGTEQVVSEPPWEPPIHLAG